MVRRETDPNFINRIANHPAVKPYVDYRGVDEPLDFSPAVGRATQTGIVWLSNGEDALCAFEQAAERDYNVHLMFADTCRGARALQVGREMLDFVRPWADRLWGLIPMSNASARWFAHRLGFRRVEIVDDETMGRCEELVWSAA